jgi:hypothetical protein
VEEDKSLLQTEQDEYLECDDKQSITWCVRCGCGNLYITVLYKDSKPWKVFIPRNTRFNCSLMMRDALAKDATYKIRRDPKQLIKDLKGNKAHACKNYSIVAKAYSCADAVASTIEKALKYEISSKKF